MQHIKFKYDKQEHEGILIKDGDEMTIKLDSGYNIIVQKKDIKILEKKELEQKETKKTAKQKNDLANITILHTGGTIASKVDYETGAVTAKFSEEDILGLFPEISERATITSKLIGNMQSEMMRFAHWNILAKEVQAAVKKGAKGIIITQGTDTLHYTAAALSFALENCPVPVILVGSQRSSDRPSSDAASNILCATEFALKSGFTGVAVCMHESINNDDCVILPGTRCRKMHSTRRDAFRAINDKAIAKISYPKLEINEFTREEQEGKFSVRLFDEKLKVGLLKAHPQMYAEELLAYKDFDGLVIELFGLGHLPTIKTDEHNAEHENVEKALRTITKKVPVAGATQTIYGRVDMNVYSPGKTLLDAGLLGQGCDITPETAFVKLAWLLSNEKKNLRELYATNLRGELRGRIEKSAFD